MKKHHKVLFFKSAAAPAPPPADAKVRMNASVGANVVETGSSGAGWNYNALDATEVGGGSSQLAYSTMTLGSGVDGYIEATVSLAGGNGQYWGVLGFTWQGAGSQFNDQQPYTMICKDNSYQIATAYGGQTGGNGTTGQTQASGDRIRVQRVGSTVYSKLSQDSGATWITVHTYTGAQTGSLVAFIGVGGTSNSPKLLNTRSNAMT